MKRKFLFMMAMLTGVGTVLADNVTVENLIVPIGGQVTLAVNYQFDAAEQYSGWQFSLMLPEGLATVKDAKGNPSFTTGGCYDTSYTFTSSTDGTTDDFVALSLQSSPMTGTSGVLISIPIVSAENLVVGNTFNATLKGIQFGNIDGVHTTFIDDVIFTITIGEPADTRIILDETSTSVPESASDVDVCVKRTIKADEWSTICLPFAMTEAQTKEAFGNDVQLADFTGYEVEEDGEDVVGLNVSFSDVDAIEANHPYLIKVSAAVTEFTVDGVDIDPEEEPTVATVKRTRKQWSEFIGTYTANTIVPEKTLFLSGNKFYYSIGATKMKAFRGYFDFFDVLTEVDDSYAKVRFFIDETATEIEGVGVSMQTDAVYSVSGVCMGTADRLKVLPKGLYIVNGKKVYNQ